MGKVRIVVDTSSNVPEAFLQEYAMIEVPAAINFGSETYLIKHEIDIPQFYQKLAQAEHHPTTSQPTPRQFADAYRQAMAEGADQVLAVTVSSRLSGTFSSARLASEEFDPGSITVWDSQAASSASGLQAVMAARYLAAGHDLAATVDYLGKVRRNTRAFLTVDTLHYLARSGRVSNLRASVGDFLKIKPILALQEGELLHIGQTRGRNRSKQELIRLITGELGQQPLLLVVIHANCEAEAQEFAAECDAALNVMERVVVEVDPAIAALGGPGLLAVAALAMDLDQ